MFTSWKLLQVCISFILVFIFKERKEVRCGSRIWDQVHCRVVPLDTAMHSRVKTQLGSQPNLGLKCIAGLYIRVQTLQCNQELVPNLNRQVHYRVVPWDNVVHARLRTYGV